MAANSNLGAFGQNPHPFAPVGAGAEAGAPAGTPGAAAAGGGPEQPGTGAGQDALAAGAASKISDSFLKGWLAVDRMASSVTTFSSPRLLAVQPSAPAAMAGAAGTCAAPPAPPAPPLDSSPSRLGAAVRGVTAVNAFGALSVAGSGAGGGGAASAAASPPQQSFATDTQKQVHASLVVKGVEALLLELREHLDAQFRAQDRKIDAVAKDVRESFPCRRAQPPSAAAQPPTSTLQSLGGSADSSNPISRLSSTATEGGAEAPITVAPSGLSMASVAPSPGRSRREMSRQKTHALEGGELHYSGETNERKVGCCVSIIRAYARFVKNVQFDYLFGVMIVLNTALLGVQIDIKARGVEQNTDFQEPEFFKFLESAFALVFSLELLMRFSVLHLRFFRSGWNLFDVVVVTAALVEETIKYNVGGDTMAGKLSMFRMMRVFKVARTLRVIRVIRAFRELRIVTVSILCCFKSLFWTLALMFMLLYALAIFILVELTEQDDPYAGSGAMVVLRRQYFPNMPRSLLSLFQSVTGGILWEEASTALEERLPWICALWVLYVGFVVFAITNAVTAIFVEQGAKVAQDDMRNVMLEERESREVIVARLRSLFHKADTVGAGVLHRNKVEALLETAPCRRLFRQLDVDLRDVVGFLELVVSVDNTIALADIDSFIHGCCHLKGSARNMDLAALAFRQKAFAQGAKPELDKMRAIYSIFF